MIFQASFKGLKSLPELESLRIVQKDAATITKKLVQFSFASEHRVIN